MTGQLHQLNMEYSPSQDRLVLKINTRDKQEARLFLTRRFTRELWDALINIMGQQPEIKQQPNPEVKKAMMAFRQEARTKKESFQKSYERGNAFPIGETPALVTGFRFVAKRKGRPARMIFVTDQKQEIGIPATENILYSFAKLMSQAVGVTGWDLTLEMGALANEPKEGIASASVH
jgi:hypothetical protein